MKIVCDNCATKYSIADEKVRGKVFKIRCKKCSHIIVVRGGEGAAAQEAQGSAADAGFPAEDSAAPAAARGQAAPASLGTGEAVWHLVVDREQIGPLTREEVHTKFRAGEVDLETYAWREGFGDWLRLGSIDDFRDLAGDAAPAPSGHHGGAGHEGATRRTDTADLFATSAAAPRDDGPAASDLFAAHNSSSAPTGETPMPANEIFGQAGGALFGAPSTAAAAPVAAAAAARPTRTSSPGFSGGGAMAASAEAPAEAGNQKMTGQRNENSVLFSLNNLQALASGGGGGGSAPAPKSTAEPRPGFANAQTEGSGLIDIRAMAASTLATGPSGGSTGKSDEPAFASAPLFSPMAAPILMPAPASGPPKWIWALLAVGVLAVAGVGILIVLIATKKPDAPVVATVTPVSPTAGNPNVVTPVTNPAAPTAPANPVVAAANPAATPKVDEPKAEHHPKDHVKAAKEPKGGHEPAQPVAAQPVAAQPVAAPPPKRSGKKDELDDLLNNASPDKPAPKHSAPREDTGGGSSDSNLPDQLDKAAIVGGMSKVKPKVADCYVQFKVPGLANVSVTIGKSGHVSSATVSGSFSGTPTGSCVEKAVKSAGFPPFKGSPQTINYPFMLR